MPDGFPVGAIVAFPGDGSRLPSPAYWAPCDGAEQSTTGDYAQLFDVIQYAHGGSGPTFFLPDLRGRFIRGVDHGAENDPDAATRTAAAPGGSGGDNVGSVQDFATGVPDVPFVGMARHLPRSGQDNAASVFGDGSTVAAWHSGSVPAGVEGGDAESRPLNLYATFYIKYRGALDGGGS